MNVQGVGAGPTGAEFPMAARGLAATKGFEPTALSGPAQSGDAISSILRDVSELDFVRLLALVERPPPPVNAVHLEDLLRASERAAAEGNVPRALVNLAEFAALDPRRAEGLAAEPGLVSIRAEVRDLLFRLAATAHMDAESRLGQAQLLQSAVSTQLVAQDVNPEVAILIAGRLLEAGGYSNCMRSVGLSQMTISQMTISQMTSNVHGSAPVPAPLTLADMGRAAIRSARGRIGSRSKWIPRIGQLWNRAPLLVLLLGWLAVGLAAGSVSAFLRAIGPHGWPAFAMAGFFTVWEVGLLGLVLFGFYARVRNLLRR